MRDATSAILWPAPRPAALSQTKGAEVATAAPTIPRTFRLDPHVSEAPDAFAKVRFGSNRTAALSAAISIAAIVYDSPHGRAGEDPADALERWAAARRAKPSDD